MAHVRQSIRENVFHSQVYPLGTNKLSALYVFTESETLEYTRLDQVRDIDRTVDIITEDYVLVVFAFSCL